jgi:uncharacterized OB-fold protein
MFAAMCERLKGELKMPADSTTANHETLEYGSCPVCGYVMFPLLPQLPCGHDQNPTLTSLDEPGVVYSWTTVWRGEDQPDNVIAMADFLGGQLRITAPVLSGEVAIGDKVKLAEGKETPYGLSRILD